MVKSIYFLFWLGVMFIYVFSPPFRGLPFGLDKMMLPLVWVYILLYRQAFFRFISVRYVKVFVILLAVTTGYLGLRFVMTPYDPKPPYNFALSLLLYIPFTFVWLNELTLRFKGNYLINDLLIVGVGLVQAAITSILVIKPSLNQYVQSGVLRNSDAALSLVNKTHLDRGYGLGSQFGGSFPVTLGLCYSHMIERASQSWFSMACLLSGPLFLLSILYNARIGLVPIIGMGVVFILLSRRNSSKGVIGLVVIVSLCALLYIAAELNLYVLEVSIRDKFDWLVEAFFRAGFSSDGKVTYIDILISGWQFPGGAENVFGTGKSMFGALVGMGSDMGYGNYIYYGGFIFLILGPLCYLWLFLYPLVKCRVFSVRLVALVYLGVFLVVNFKGSALFWPEYIKMTILILLSSYFRIAQPRV